MKYIFLILSCLTSLAWAATSSNDWGESCQTFDINKTKFGMSYATVTNASASYRKVKIPNSELKVVSYMIAKVPENRIPVGGSQSDVEIYAIKNVYFNNSNQVVAIEIKFSNLDTDKVKYIQEILYNKYKTISSDLKGNYKYDVTPEIELVSEVVPIDFITKLDGRRRAVTFGVSNLYYHKTKYKEALEEAGKKVFPKDLF